MIKCFKCGTEKDRSEFYERPNSKSGLAGVCKKCMISTAVNRKILLRATDKVWAESERLKARARDKSSYKRSDRDPHEMKIIRNRYKLLFPEKVKCKNLLAKKFIIKGLERHHWSYNIEHACDIIHLSVINHAILHKNIIYDQQFFMYRRIDTNELLDTKEKHIEFAYTLFDLIGEAV